MPSKKRRSAAKNSRTARKPVRRFGFESLEGRSLLTTLGVATTQNAVANSIALVRPLDTPDFSSTPTVVAADNGGTYNGAAFAATATVNGAASLESVAPTLTYYTGTSAGGSGTSSAPSIAGSYTVVASFAGSSDYSPAQSSPVTFTIAPATPTVTVADNSGTYNSAAFAASNATVAGINNVAGASLEGITLSLIYFSGTQALGTPLSAVPSTLGTYTVLDSFAGSLDYASAGASATFTIGKAASSVSVTGTSGPYTGVAVPATATVTGVGSQHTAATSLEGVTPSLTYFSGAAATNSPLSGAPTASGTYTALLSFAGSNDYISATASATFTIGKAAPTVNVTDASGVFNGAAFTATGTVAGISNVPGGSLESVAPTLAYYAGTSAAGTPSSNAPTATGAYTVLASFAGSTDYTSGSASSTFTIIKAAAPTVTVTDASGVYNTTAYVATAKVGGSASLERVAPTLSYFLGTSASGTALAGAPTTVGTYTVLASFVGSTDYATGAASATFTIGSATPTVTVTDRSGTQNGAAFTATVGVAGVGSQSPTAASLEGVTLALTYYSGAGASGSPLSGAPTAVGTYSVLASFAGSTDYTAASASANFTISAVVSPPVLAIGGPAVTYVRGTGPTAVAPAATLTTGGGAFANASVSVIDKTLSSYPNDRLGIGSGGLLTVSGSSLVVNSVAVGSFSGGGASPLAIQFNANATQAAVLAVVQNVTFTNVSPTAIIANRTITFQLTDGLGNPGAAVTQTILVPPPPAITFFAPSVVYHRAAGPIDVAPSAALSTGDGAFANASLTVTDKNQVNYPNDRLGISSSGLLVVSGASLLYNGVTIGSFTGGVSTPLAIKFNSNATQAAVQAVVDNVTFRNVSSTAILANRVISFQLTDGLGNASAAVSKTVVVSH